MIKFENTEVCGWEPAIRGMRNPKNSWSKSDSDYCLEGVGRCTQDCPHKDHNPTYCVGDNDFTLMKSLRKAGTDHRKYMRMIVVYVDITAPLYWWKEFDTYKVGTVANSCSTMHKIHEKAFSLEDFSCEHLINPALYHLEDMIKTLNEYRIMFINFDKEDSVIRGAFGNDKKNVWWQMIQLLPSSYNQKRTVMFNYEVLANAYKSRRHHKLDEWNEDCHGSFCDWVKSLPYSELITGAF